MPEMAVSELSRQCPLNRSRGRRRVGRRGSETLTSCVSTVAAPSSGIHPGPRNHLCAGETLHRGPALSRHFQRRWLSAELPERRRSRKRRSQPKAAAMPSQISSSGSSSTLASRVVSRRWDTVCKRSQSTTDLWARIMPSSCASSSERARGSRCNRWAVATRGPSCLPRWPRFCPHPLTTHRQEVDHGPPPDPGPAGRPHR